MARDPAKWQQLRSDHDDAWRHYEDVVSDIHASYEEMAQGGTGDIPDDAQLGRLSDAWERLGDARRRIDHYFKGEAEA
ncbi:hypothetical protein [Marinobacter salicampi]|uniref:hypothetical protein n=1 Tax=Marinobacter salicampi TaxID=435907 RepID=UPI001408404A|nr:hypothetical protein [Marinobacter salicampi]